MEKRAEIRQFEPGDRAETAGVYRVTHYLHRRPHELTINSGEIFPVCRACGDKVRYVLLSEAEVEIVTFGVSDAPPCVLVADEERLGAHPLLEMLTRAGYAVEYVQSLRLARSLLEHSDYDAVITDLHLDCEGAGLEIAKFAKRRRPFPVVFIYTDSPTPDIMREMAKIPVDYCAIAPFSATEIGSALERMIARRHAVETLC